MKENELKLILVNGEKRGVEFKEAKHNFSDKEVCDYCAALANEGGGYLILGVTNNGKPKGTIAYNGTIHKLESDIYQQMSVNIRIFEFEIDAKRILVFKVPGHNMGQLVHSTGKYSYPMRVGDSLREMDSAEMKRILNESATDWSSQIAPNVLVSELDPLAIGVLREKWAIKAQNSNFLEYSDEKTLRSLELINDDGVTNAAIVLLAKKLLIDKALACAEIIFEWRQEPGKIPYDFRKEWREPFLLIYDDLWQVLNQRNLRIPFQEGFIQRDIYAFTEKTIREAILNAVMHRDYTVNTQSIFIKASPNSFFIQSPGGLVTPVTFANILTKQAWRNRRIAEVLQKIGLVERSGQGVDDIYEQTIKEGKGLPSFTGSDDYTVQLTIPAIVKDPGFILYLEKIINLKQIHLAFEEIYELEQIREKGLLHNLDYKNKFLELGLIEKSGSGRGIRYLLSRQFYEYSDKRGKYTKIKGISRDVKKELILKHVSNFTHATTAELQQALDMKQTDVNNLLQELKKAKKIHHIGSRKFGYWELLVKKEEFLVKKK